MTLGDRVRSVVRKFLPMEDVVETRRISRELLWADVFNSTIASSAWLANRSFSPGRWAVGYAYLYVLYRILDELKPQRILDLGLGQSSRLIAQYAAGNPSVEHVIVEASDEWIDFFRRGVVLPDNSRIVRLDYAFEPFREENRVRVYEGFAEKLGKKAFDLVSVDGPLSADMMRYARIDLLKILPQGLARDFAVLFDDVHLRQNDVVATACEEALTVAGVACGSVTYQGEKDFRVITSDSWKFLRTL